MDMEKCEFGTDGLLHQQVSDCFQEISLGASIQTPSLAHFCNITQQPFHILTHQVMLFGADSRRPEVGLVLELKEQKTPLAEQSLCKRV